MYQSLFFNKVAGLNKETLAQVFSCEFCEISKKFQNASGRLLLFIIEQLFAGPFLVEHLSITSSIKLKII